MSDTTASTKIHSCTSCRRSKIQCDKESPACGPCLRKGIECAYPASGTRYTVSREKSCTECQRRRRRCDRRQPCSRCQKLELACAYAGARSELPRSTSNVEPMEIHGDITETTGQSIECPYPVVLLGTSPNSDATVYLRPSIAHTWTLFSLYAENVDPLVKFFHLRSFQKQVLSSVTKPSMMHLGTETLLFSMCFAGVVSISDAECLNKVGSSKQELLERYRFGLEQCLLKGDFLDKPTMSALQALVLYIFGVCHAPMDAPVEALLALAIRLAMRLGIHEDINARPQQPVTFTTIAQKTEIEMRRRLWWQILALDVQIAEYYGNDPTLYEGMWSCKMPGNLDDVELDVFSDLPLPPPHGETFDPVVHLVPQDPRTMDEFIDRYERQTDMSYALLRIEMSYAMRQFAFSESFCKANRYRHLQTEAELFLFLEKHMNSVDQRFLMFCTRNDTFTFFERNAVKLILSRHLMMVKKNNPPEEVLHNAIMVLEAAASMRKTHIKWSWSLRSYVELDALELLWKCLVSAPEAAANGVEAESLGTPGLRVSEEVGHAWVLGDIAFRRGEEDCLDRCYADKWARIKAFHDTALARRPSRQQPQEAVTSVLR